MVCGSHKPAPAREGPSLTPPTPPLLPGPLLPTWGKGGRGHSSLCGDNISCSWGVEVLGQGSKGSQGRLQEGPLSRDP